MNRFCFGRRKMKSVKLFSSREELEARRGVEIHKVGPPLVDGGRVSCCRVCCSTLVGPHDGERDPIERAMVL